MNKYIYCVPLIVILLSISFKSFSSSITGASVLHGEINISHVSSQDVVISTRHDGAVVNFQTFDVDSSESVTINQRSSESKALFNVLDRNPTRINGTLNVLGTLFLVNPNGIFVGRNAVIQAERIVISSLFLDTVDFLNKEYNFNQFGAESPLSINGAIIANEIILIGSEIHISGFLDSPSSGNINILTGASQSITLTAVPLPSTILLFCSGLIGMFGARRRAADV